MADDLARLESWFVIEELPRAGEERRFEVVLPYIDARRTEYRRRQWSLNAQDEDANPHAVMERQRQEIAQFRRDIERWLSQSRMQLVAGDTLPLLAPIEDGA
jgi:hypothetical protein